MPIYYFVTALPPLQRGDPSPISRAEFITRARSGLPAYELAELERLLLLEEVENGVRIQTNARLLDPDASGDALSRLMHDRDPATANGPEVADLPRWMHRPRPIRVQLRRFWHITFEHATSEFLREWADFIVNLEEVATGLLCKRQDLPRKDFLSQMSGSFDTTARYLINRYEQQDAGLTNRFPWVSELLAALDDPDQQAAERTVNSIRWRAIEHICSPDPFAIDALLAYYLKMRIVDQEASWSAERGNALLDRSLAEANATITAILEAA